MFDDITGVGVALVWFFVLLTIVSYIACGVYAQQVMSDEIAPKREVEETDSIKKEATDA